jgi:DNA (cytosine-5)-methyltransferase 1
MRANQYKVVSLFSGVMGLDIGLETNRSVPSVGVRRKGGRICETMRLNKASGRLHSGLRIYEGDSTMRDPKKVMKDCGLNLPLSFARRWALVLI